MRITLFVKRALSLGHWLLLCRYELTQWQRHYRMCIIKKWFIYITHKWTNFKNDWKRGNTFWCLKGNLTWLFLLFVLFLCLWPLIGTCIIIGHKIFETFLLCCFFYINDTLKNVEKALKKPWKGLEKAKFILLGTLD